MAIASVVVAATVPGSAAPGAAGAQERPPGGTARDWEIAREQVAWAVNARRQHDIREFGELLGAIGERLVGTRYEPHTLEIPGPERLVINLEALDCVTFVENVLVMARLAWTAPAGLVENPAGLVEDPAGLVEDPAGLVDDPAAFQAAYRRELTAIRYRGGDLDGYPSRLHYFSEWIADNDAMGLVEAISRRLGGVEDESAIDFMSTHPEAYRQLADPGALAEITAMEARLAGVPRHYLPEDGIEAAASGIRNGDIIAATSTVAGLDIAHTGIAVRRDGVLRLLHAPLVGSHVQISEESLAERILRIEGQDGIMVARPLPPGAGVAPPAPAARKPGGGAAPSQGPARPGVPAHSPPL